MTALSVLLGIFGYATQVLGGIQLAKPWKASRHPEPTFKKAFKALLYAFYGLGVTGCGELFVSWAGATIPDAFWLTAFTFLKVLVFLIGFICTAICFMRAAKARRQRA
ncbi:MAG TPA: hypothetical protein VFZ58_04790 [Candidatus Saccharimonadales bacterium]